MAEYGGVIAPTTPTLYKYGLVMLDWEQMLQAQDFKCAVCEKLPPSKKLFIDHEHVRGWKQMEPDERRQYVRGLLCYTCNRFILNYRVTPWLLRQAASYLDRYLDKRY